MTYLAWFLSFCVGYISLSEEILWVRIVSFVFEGTPKAFAMVLTAFLGGIALGALLGKRLSERGKATPMTAAWLLLAASAMLLLLPWGIAEVSQSPLQHLWLLLLIMVGAALKGTLFPIVHHLGSVAGDTLGRSVSRVYFCNIMGSTLGPLVTGLYLLDHFSSGNSLQLLGACCALVAMTGFLFSVKTTTRWRAASGVAASVLCLLCLPAVLPQGANLMRQLAMTGGEASSLHLLIENRHGVVHTVNVGGTEDLVFGGNVYDGKTNIDLANNSNMVDRAYLLYALHPAPKRVLVIGLSSGAWVRILTAVPGVEQIDVVEINPGYLQMARAYPQLAPILDDPRVKIHIDDGRRWLRRSHQQFDMVVMNTTFHWRANITNLLSVEMLKLVQGALAPGGMFAFNTTNSFDAFYTASQVFPHAYLFRNFVYAADHDFRQELPQAVARIKAFELDGHPLVQESPQGQQALEKLSAIKFIELQQVERVFPRPLQAVTDQNMITEYRFGR